MTDRRFNAEVRLFLPFSLLLFLLLLWTNSSFALSPDDDPEIHRLRSAAETEQHQFKAAVQDVESAKSDFARTKAEYDREAARLQSIVNEKNHLVDQGNRLNTEIQRHKDNFANYMAKANEYKAKNNMAEAKRYYDMAQNEKNQGQAKQGQLGQIKSKLTSLESEYNSQKSKVGSLSSTLTTKKANVERLIARARDAETSFKNAVARYESAKSALVSEMQTAARTGFDRGKSEGHELGKNQGIETGLREGRIEGSKVGQQDGIAAGRERDYKRGFERGYEQGAAKGSASGKSDGARKGEIEGRKKGSWQRGYDDGHEQGLKDGYTSDAEEKGFGEGGVSGEKDGNIEGGQAGYTAGYNETVAEFEKAPLTKKSVLQQIGPNSALGERIDQELAPMLHRNNALGLRSISSACSYSREVVRKACYEGYERSFNQARDEAYRHYYSQAYARGKQEGYDKTYNEFYNHDYPESLNEGLSAGQNKGYAEKYQPAFEEAYRLNYEHYRQLAYKNKDQQDPSAYDDGQGKGHGDGYAKAYDENYKKGYAAGYEKAKKVAYAEAYKTGQTKGSDDARNHYKTSSVVKILSYQLIDGNRDGVYQPKERFDLRIKMSNTALIASKKELVLAIRFREDTKQAVLYKNEIELTDLPPQSEITLTLKDIGENIAETLVNNDTIAIDIVASVNKSGEVISKEKLHYVVTWPFIFENAEFKDELLVGQEVKLAFAIRNKSSKNSGESLQVKLVPAESFLLPVEDTAQIGIIKPEQNAQGKVSFKVESEGIFKKATVDLIVVQEEAKGGTVKLGGNISTKYSYNEDSQILLLVKKISDTTKRLLATLQKAKLKADIYDIDYEGQINGEILSAYSNKTVLLALNGGEEEELGKNADLYAQFLGKGGNILVSGISIDQITALGGSLALAVDAPIKWKNKMKEEDKSKDFAFTYKGTLGGKDGLKVDKFISGNFYHENAFRYRGILINDSFEQMDENTMLQTILQAELWNLPFAGKIAILQRTTTAGPLKEAVKKAITADCIEEMSYTEMIDQNPYEGAVAEQTLVNRFSVEMEKWGYANKTAIDDIRDMYYEVEEFRKTVSSGLFHSKRRNIGKLLERVNNLF